MPHADPALCSALAADLAAAGFRSDALRDAWGAEADAAIGRGLRVPALRTLAARTDPVATLARLLVLGVPQPRDAVDAALPRTGADGLATLGLAETGGGEVQPRAIVRPQSYLDTEGTGEWWFASDLDELAAGGGPLAEDHVLGVGGASLTLAGLHLPTPARRVLDLGTGCGIQALRARRYANAVVATDLSERALGFARLNALLNRDERIETRLGSLFEPVTGETFDRIVSNPPFVITPRATGVPGYEYRDGGLVGDALVERLVADVGAHLAPPGAGSHGGVAQFLGNWESRDGVPGLDRIRAWVAASPVPLDAWVVEREELDPVSYAEMWIRDGGTAPGSERHDALLSAWLDDFGARGVTAIGFGYVLLRRAEGRPTLDRFERVTHPIPSEGGLGAHLAQALEAHDRLARMDDEALAAATLRTAADVTEARHHLPGVGDPQVIELRQGAGFGRAVQADPGLAALVGACDGDLPVGPLVAAIADLLEVDRAALRHELLPRVRELLFTGFLRFAA
ncbi:N5-glutamine methyltransferase family protein [Microbacterium album]|uniref:Methyltransferase n=1 Tax=Microbacterium album TaxID=2053191 RepID=A0A917MLR3_9MICO|nr:class I SAM-dependent methyltransferase [Microbacterium album]GGH44203.1 methyltransferase [Microbacterium album]